MSGPRPPAIPVIRPTVTSVELDGERVLYDTETGKLQKLDVIGSIVWSCFDGATDIAELSADLSDAFGADPAQVRSDVEALVATLIEEGMLLSGAAAAAPPPAAGEAVVSMPDDPGPTAGDLAVLTDPPGG